jgi:hypothetical protein
MAKVLKCATGAAVAYVEKDFTAANEVWFTADLYFPSAALALWFSSGGFADLISLINSPSDNARAILGLEDASPDHLYFVDQLAQVEIVGVPSPPSNAWHTYEIHWKKGDVVELYIDGSLATSFTETTNEQVHQFLIGLVNTSVIDASSVLYVNDLKIGTIRGGSSIFLEDFEGVTPLANFDATFGDASIEDDPSPSSVEVDPVGVCIAFDDETLEPNPAWTRIDDPDGYRVVSDWSIRRGRQSELEKTGTGTATITIIDQDGTLDPTNPDGPFYGKLDPMKQAAIALRNPGTDTWHTIFRGFVADWFYEVDISGAFASVRLELVDAFELLAALEMTPGHQGDTAPSGSEGDIYFQNRWAYLHINKILDDVGWPGELRRTLTGNVIVGGFIDSGPEGMLYARRDQALAALFDAADAEFPGLSNVFVDKVGRLTFLGRYARFTPEDPDWQIDFWDAGTTDFADAAPTSVAPISGLAFRRSKDDIVNSSIALPQGVDEADVPGSLVIDTDSINTFGWRSLSFQNLLVFKGRESPDTLVFDVDAVDETKLYAEFYVANCAQPTTRVERVVFRSRRSTGIDDPVWLILCQIDISDVLHLQTSHPGGGGFDEDYFVEGISYDAQPLNRNTQDVTLTLDVSPRAIYGLSPFSADSSSGDVRTVTVEGAAIVGETLTIV